MGMNHNLKWRNDSRKILIYCMLETFDIHSHSKMFLFEWKSVHVEKKSKINDSVTNKISSLRFWMIG